MEIYETPLGNTGSVLSEAPAMENQFTAVLDWLQGCFKLSDYGEFEYFLSLVTDICSDEWIRDDDRPLYKGRHFTHSIRTIRGSILGWNIDDDNKLDCWLSLTGKTLIGANFDNLRQFLLFLITLETRFTRIDLAIDDYSKSLKPQYFKTAYQRGHHHGFRKMSFIENFESSDSEEEQGFTVYMGRRNGNKLTRFYNKSVESKGEIDAYRLEVEYKDDYTKNVLDYLLSAESFAKAIANLVVSAIDFRDNDIQLLWWNAFITRLEAHPVHLLCRRAKPTIEASMNWIEHQVETTLAVVEEFCDRITCNFDDWLKERIASGRQRMKSVHRGAINEALRLYDRYIDPRPLPPLTPF
ncbi:replication initiation factor domain-containing protein [Pseudanabaena yagii]|uniref:Replication initiation factor domain-containing protein n=1 Tax=Pseudanabaena yagii GIHE-NHR1 TaxID=2722753 RepID=A0ABX1LRB8_9CYAN|nr:replication initiation factor domain-containing protein [Pseudanabaena yagii]NMF57886.1 replication initiation factor domain-containing protein [Pseudanabaena yagii GIHE-NHR1]